MPRLIVFDALGLAYRAFYALSRWETDRETGEKVPRSTLVNSRREPTNAIFGMASTIQKLRRELRPDRWALAWDGPGPTFRHELYDEYKITRKPMPKELAAQLTPIEELVRALGLPVIEKPGMEADDVMATLAKRGAAEGYDVLLVTGDKDMLQVVNDRVTVLSPQPRGDELARFDPDGVRAKWGVAPEQIRDVLALMGDTSDNIPGVPGIGEKTAVELMRQFGTIDAMYERLDEVKKPALHRKLDEHRVLAKLSRELATVQSDLDLGLSLDELAVAPIRRDDLLDLARRWEIRRLESIANELGVGGDEAGAPVASRPAERRGTAAELDLAPRAPAGAPAPVAPTAAPTPPRFGVPGIAPPAAPLPAVLSSAPQGTLDLWGGAEAEAAAAVTLDEMVLRLHEVRARGLHGVAVLPLSEGPDPRHATLVGIALAARDGTAAYLPLAHESGPNLLPEHVRGWLAPLLADATAEKVGHDLKRDRHVLAAAGLTLAGGAFDLHVGSFLCDPSRDHGLEALARDVLGVALAPLEAPPVRGKPRPGPSSLPVAAAAAAAEHAVSAFWPLADALRAQLEAREQWALYRDLEHPMIDVLWAMERTGIAVDSAVLKEMSTNAAAEIARLEAALFELAGESFNPGSGPQLARILFEKLKLPPGRRTKSGYSTDQDVLESLAGEHALPRRLLEWRALTKLKSTYLDALPASADPADGRVHTTYELTGAATGRLSSYDPNLQNIPMRTEQGRAIRRAFVAAPGCVLVGADYSQIELRVMAHLSGDPNLVEAFRSGEDVHASTARKIFKIEGDVDATLRARAKVVNFGVMYGMGPRSLAQQMGIPLEDAKQFIDGYFGVYAGVRRFLDSTLAEARERGWVQTLLGRRRYLPSLRSANGMERSNAERAAINTPIQGSAADLVKLAMIRVQRAFGSSGTRLLLQVHDELLLECPASSAASVVESVRREMEGCYPLRVPLTVSVGTGATWYDVH